MRNVQVKVSNIPGKKLEHQGIRVQLLGQIELLSARGHFHDFVALGEPAIWEAALNCSHARTPVPCLKRRLFDAARDLEFPGELTSQKAFPFEFGSVEMQYDSYKGLQVRLRCTRLHTVHCCQSLL